MGFNVDNKVKTGLLVNIMGMDCTNGGVTSGKTQAILVMPDYNIGPFGIDDPEIPLLTLIPGKGGRKWIAVPANKEGKPANPEKWHMMGGHFIYTSDSRFSKYSDSPIHVHDRYEW